MNSIKKFAEFVNENLNEAITKVKVYDDSAGPDEEGFKLLNKLRPNDKIQFIAGDIDPDDLDIETGVIKAKDAKKLFDSPFNEGSYSMNIGNAKEDKIAREYGASQIARMDTDDEKYQELGQKFKYIIDGETLEEYDKSFDDLIKSLKRARLKYVRIEDSDVGPMIVF